MLPNGEYEINTGIRSSAVLATNRKGKYIFSWDKKASAHTIYHELAHSLQKKYDLFNDDKIGSLYSIAKKGLESNQSENKLLDKSDYKRYLLEAHSEIFAHASMMLRAENNVDFMWQTLKTHSSGVRRTLAATIDVDEQKQNSNHSAKFYATKSVMSPMIAEIKKIRKEGRTAEFFDDKGALKFEKLAKLCEDVVMKNAYSPRTLNSFFKYDIFDNHLPEEKGWRGDVLKSIVQSPLSISNEKQPTVSAIRHNKLLEEQNTQVKSYLDKASQKALEGVSLSDTETIENVSLQNGKEADPILAQAAKAMARMNFEAKAEAMQNLTPEQRLVVQKMMLDSLRNRIKQNQQPQNEQKDPPSNTNTANTPIRKTRGERTS